MATAQQFIDACAEEVGYSRWTDEAEGTKYGRDYATRHGARIRTERRPIL